METTTIIDTSATPAKCARGEAVHDVMDSLLARLQNNHIIPNFVPRTNAEVRANIAAAIDAIREPWDRGPVRDTDDDDEELVEPAVPVPVRRQRKRSLAKVCEAARKAGADRVIVDGVVIVLSPSAAVPTESNGNEFDEWMARHANPTKGN